MVWILSLPNINLHRLLVLLFGTRVRCVKILAADEVIRRPPFLVFYVVWLHPHRSKNLLLQHLFGSSTHRQPMTQAVSCFSTAGRPTNMPLLTSMDRGSFRCKNSQPGWPNWSRGETSRSSSTATTACEASKWPSGSASRVFHLPRAWRAGSMPGASKSTQPCRDISLGVNPAMHRRVSRDVNRLNESLASAGR